MRDKPNHNCFRMRECPACAFELGAQLAKKKPTESAKYVWMVVGSLDGIRFLTKKEKHNSLTPRNVNTKTNSREESGRFSN